MVHALQSQKMRKDNYGCLSTTLQVKNSSTGFLHGQDRRGSARMMSRFELHVLRLQMVNASAELLLLPGSSAQPQALVGVSTGAPEALTSAPLVISISGRSGGATVEPESVRNRQVPLSWPG